MGTRFRSGGNFWPLYMGVFFVVSHLLLLYVTAMIYQHVLLSDVPPCVEDDSYLKQQLMHKFHRMTDESQCRERGESFDGYRLAVRSHHLSKREVNALAQRKDVQTLLRALGVAFPCHLDDLFVLLDDPRDDISVGEWMDVVMRLRSSRSPCTSSMLQRDIHSRQNHLADAIASLEHEVKANATAIMFKAGDVLLRTRVQAIKFRYRQLHDVIFPAQWQLYYETMHRLTAYNFVSGDAHPSLQQQACIATPCRKQVICKSTQLLKPASLQTDREGECEEFGLGGAQVDITPPTEVWSTTLMDACDEFGKALRGLRDRSVRMHPAYNLDRRDDDLNQFEECLFEKHPAFAQKFCTGAGAHSNFQTNSERKFRSAKRVPMRTCSL